MVKPDGFDERMPDAAAASPGDTAALRRAALSAALVGTGYADHTAFVRVYRMTSAKLFGICLRICGERQAAEDVLQEVYVIVWRRAQSYEPQRASPVTWLAAIARHRALDWRRANQRRNAMPLPDDRAEPLREPADPTPSADMSMIEQEDHARLIACLDALDERPRAAIRSAFMDGMSYSQLATHADVPLGTMKSMVRRALLRLRDCLDDDA